MNMILLLIAFTVLTVLVARLVPQPWKGRIQNGLKGGLTVAMLWFLLRWSFKTPDGDVVPAWKLIVDLLSEIDGTTFVWAVAVGAAVRFAGILASMWRWQLVLRGQNIEMPFRHIFGAFLIGRAIGFFLPSTAGLDAYKLYDAARFSGRSVEVTAGTVLEKVLGVTGIFLTFLVALPFGISIFGENAGIFAALAVPMATGVIGALLVLLWYPALVQWLIESLPIPGKERLRGLITRVSNAAAAYRDKKQIVLLMLFCSFAVHFTTAVMYYFMAIAVGAGAKAAFWPIVFGSAVQIFATVIGPTIGGMGVREAAQLLLLGGVIGPAPAIVSAALGFWVGEVPTLFGFFFWMIRGDEYRPGYTRVEGRQVDYDQAARAARELETEQERELREATASEKLPPWSERLVHNMGLGLGAGVISGVLIGVLESIVIAQGGFGEEAQVMWFGPLAYSLLLGGLGIVGGAVLSILPMGRQEAQGWTPSLGLIACIVPLGLFIVVFRLRRDVYLEQLPPAPVLLGVLAAFGALALLLFFVGPRLFRGGLGRIANPGPALGLLAAVLVGGFVAASVLGPGTGEKADGAPVPAALADAPNVLLIMVDTLRADHLSCYDAAQGANTPNICSLLEGRGGNRGDRLAGFSHASWTKPATASLLTSLLPSSHNAMSKPSSVSEEVTFLSEALQSHGYATGGVVSNINLAQSFGFDQGYDEYNYLGPDYLFGAGESSSKLILYQLARQIVFRLKPGLRFGDFYQDSEVVNGVAFDFIDRHARSRFFLFAHYMDPHDPYFEHPYNGVGVARVTGEPEPEQAEELRALYKGEIEYLDGNVGKLFDKLRALGLYDDMLIVLTSDHGEEFQEHGGWWHGLTLYDEQIAVPLLIKWPAGTPGLGEGNESEVARLIDVAPTILAAAGAPVPAEMQGIDLTKPGSLRTPKDLEVYSEEDHEGNVLWSLRTRETKLLSANEGNPRGLPTRELYNLIDDPEELDNLLEEGDSWTGVETELAMHAEAQRTAAQSGAVQGGGDVEMTRDECEQLRMLGYVDDCSHIAN